MLTKQRQVDTTARGGSRSSTKSTSGVVRETVEKWPTPPHGLKSIIKTFGDPRGAVDIQQPSPDWGKKYLARARLTVPLALGWKPDRTITSFRCHTLLVPIFERVFETLHEQGLDDAMTTFDGCYNYRLCRGGTRLSTHSWGIAIDLNAASNRMVTEGDQHRQLVALFRDHGFEWGGDWTGRRRDPMHFQYCTGY